MAEKRTSFESGSEVPSRILTSGIRNELSKGLKLNTCKGESEQQEEEKARATRRGNRAEAWAL